MFSYPHSSIYEWDKNNNFLKLFYSYRHHCQSRYKFSRSGANAEGCRPRGRCLSPPLRSPPPHNYLMGKHAAGAHVCVSYDCTRMCLSRRHNYHVIIISIFGKHEFICRLFKTHRLHDQRPPDKRRDQKSGRATQSPCPPRVWVAV